MSQYVCFVRQVEISRILPPKDISDVTAIGRVARRVIAALKKLVSITPHINEEQTAEFFNFDAENLLEKLQKYHLEVMRHWHVNGQRLIIGEKDLREIMALPEFGRVWTFTARARRYNNSCYPEIMGLEVTVVPWMEGMVILP